MKYLVIETHRESPKYQQFIHFIELENVAVGTDVYYFVGHLYMYGKQIVDRVYFSKTRLNNW